VFACNEHESLYQRFNRFGEQFFDFYKTLKLYNNICFSLSNAQQKQFNAYFEQIQQQYWELLGNDYIGTIRRLGLITFRAGMMLTVLRIMDSGNINTTIVCSNTDFQIAMEILKVLLQHSAFVFRQLPAATPAQISNPKMALFQAFPDQFDRAKYHEIAAQLQNRQQANCPICQCRAAYKTNSRQLYQEKGVITYNILITSELYFCCYK
jgi:hypothetical protein